MLFVGDDWAEDHVRHEVSCNRMEVRYLRRQVVAAAGRSWGQPDPGDAGEGGSSPDNAGTRRHCRTVWVRSARRKGVREKPAFDAP